MRKFSIVIPIGPGELAWAGLEGELDREASLAERIWVMAEGDPSSEPRSGRVLRAPRGRASQLDAGARAATGEALWFLHADSRLSPGAGAALARAYECRPRALHYLRLRFREDGPALMRINEVGALVRCRTLGLPFGDQGFALPRALFEETGGYCARAGERGEDHLFVWALKRLRVPAREVPDAWIRTSARRYAERGWTRLSLEYQRITWTQAASEAWRLARSRRSGAAAIFTKTPGLSPVKTRLAAELGRERAEAFHWAFARSAERAAREAAELAGIAPYWALAERDALVREEYAALARIPQGGGSLGERLARVYEELRARHGFAILVGADCPTMSARELVEAARIARAGRFALGPARDGGFYLFAGKHPIPREKWLAVPYSAASTATALVEQVSGIAPVERLGVLSDVDRVEDLAGL